MAQREQVKVTLPKDLADAMDDLRKTRSPVETRSGFVEAAVRAEVGRRTTGSSVPPWLTQGESDSARELREQSSRAPSDVSAAIERVLAEFPPASAPSAATHAFVGEVRPACSTHERMSPDALEARRGQECPECHLPFEPNIDLGAFGGEG